MECIGCARNQYIVVLAIQISLLAVLVLIRKQIDSLCACIMMCWIWMYASDMPMAHFNDTTVNCISQQVPSEVRFSDASVNCEFHIDAILYCTFGNIHLNGGI